MDLESMSGLPLAFGWARGLRLACSPPSAPPTSISSPIELLSILATTLFVLLAIVCRRGCCCCSSSRRGSLRPASACFCPMEHKGSGNFVVHVWPTGVLFARPGGRSWWAKRKW